MEQSCSVSLLWNPSENRHTFTSQVEAKHWLDLYKFFASNPRSCMVDPDQWNNQHRLVKQSPFVDPTRGQDPSRAVPGGQVTQPLIKSGVDYWSIEYKLSKIKSKICRIFSPYFVRTLELSAGARPVARLMYYSTSLLKGYFQSVCRLDK